MPPYDAADIADFTERRYYEDPTLTFEESMSTGCHIDLTLAELNDFCRSNNDYNMVLFQNLYNLNYIGKYGNSNPYYKEDWVEVTKKAFTASTNPGLGGASSCSIYQNAQINIYYK